MKKSYPEITLLDEKGGVVWLNFVDGGAEFGVEMELFSKRVREEVTIGTLIYIDGNPYIITEIISFHDKAPENSYEKMFLYETFTCKKEKGGIR